MLVPFFETCNADSNCSALFGTDPMRIWPDQAPKDAQRPYAVFTRVNGEPENVLDQAPDIDLWTLLIEVFADSEDEARTATEAIRDAVELEAHIIAFSGTGIEDETQYHTDGFTLDWWVSR